MTALLIPDAIAARIQQLADQENRSLEEMFALLISTYQSRDGLESDDVPLLNDQVDEQARALNIQFLRMIAHELRSHLGIIKGFSSSLLAQDITWEAQKQQKFIAIIDETVDRMDDFIEQMRDYALLQSGTFRIHPIPTTVGALVEMAAPILQTAAENHDLRLSVANENSLLEADPLKIVQTLAHTVNNAVKHAPPGSPITVNITNVDHHIQVDVGDQGSPMSPSSRASLFTPFYYVDGNPRQKTSGFEMAVSKGIVEAHGGSMWIDDQREQGNQISFTLPLLATQP
jgi:K+-sensing histidine kinase KdpD